MQGVRNFNVHCLRSLADAATCSMCCPCIQAGSPGLLVVVAASEGTFWTRFGKDVHGVVLGRTYMAQDSVL